MWFRLVIAERAVINKERLAGYYRLSAYFLAKVFVEILVMMVPPLFSVTIWYWMSAANGSVLAYIQVLGLIWLHVTASQVSSYLPLHR